MGDRLTPEMQLSERGPPAAETAPDADAPLAEVPSTLIITLAARAHGDALFPPVAVGDRQAAQLLARLVPDPGPYMQDRASIWGVLARTRILRAQCQRFFERYPAATGVNLGCGLTDYFQWLDNGHNRWIDADLPEVTALRNALLALPHERQSNRPADLARPGWWQRLGLPGPGSPSPVSLLCEGVLMYLTPPQVQAFLHEVGTQAPAGSQLLLDAMCWLTVGRAGWNRSVRHTGAQFQWGLRRPAELAAAHPRLRLVAEHRVMDDHGAGFRLASALMRRLFGVPIYAVYALEVSA